MTKIDIRLDKAVLSAPPAPVTLSVKDIPFQEALGTLLWPRGLDYCFPGDGTLLVVPAADVQRCREAKEEGEGGIVPHKEAP